MSIAFLGDIHGNIDALRAVLGALSELGVRRIYCTGDVVGYGASPGECVDAVRGAGIPCVKGNHDDYVSRGGVTDWQIRPEARKAILWTQRQLSAEQVRWLHGLPHKIEAGGFSVVHASHAYLPHWPYVLNERAAIHNFLFQRCAFAFSGHSHVPLYVAHRHGHRPKLDLLRNVLLPSRQKVLIGVGAVGQPRDSDPRACMVLYDPEVKSIRVHRVVYDVAAAQARIRDAGLPSELADRLAVGQ
ncbi:MAG: metallophosphoesterase family protein [Lentisphaeria bacterium]|nr:metallophosphoesterase family protein [Lentisphaeria bacterium]